MLHSTLVILRRRRAVFYNKNLASDILISLDAIACIYLVSWISFLAYAYTYQFKLSVLLIINASTVDV